MVDVIDVKGAFERLGLNIEKGKLVFDASFVEDICPYISLLVTGEDKQRLQVYSFDSDIKIAREKHDRSGEREELVQTGRKPIYNTHYFSHEWSTYYVFRGKKLVTDENDIKKIIKESTGVDLPEISTGKEHEYVHMPVPDSVATEAVLDEDYDIFLFLEEQPNKEDMEREAYELKLFLKSLPEKFGLSNLRVLFKNIDGLISTASKISKEYEEREPMRRRREKKISTFLDSIKKYL